MNMERRKTRVNSGVEIALKSTLQFNHSDIKSATLQQKQTALAAIDRMASVGLASPNQKEFVQSAATLIDLSYTAPSHRKAMFEYNGPNCDVFTHALDAVYGQLGVLVSHLANPNEDKKTRERQQYSIHLLSLLAKKQPGRIKNELVNIFDQYMPQIISGLLQGKFSYDHALEVYLEQKPETWESILKQINNILNKTPVEYLQPRISTFLRSDSADNRSKGIEISRSILIKRGYSQRQVEILFNEWDFDLHPWYKLNYLNINHNLESMFKLEYKRPGITTWLRQNYGIRHFGRYPIESLIDQYDYQNDTVNPWGLIIYPRADWNGAFHDDFYVHKNLRDQLITLGKRTGIHYRMRIAETGVDKLNTKTKQSLQHYEQASFGILGGHGSKDTIYMGHGYRQHEMISKEHLLVQRGYSSNILNLFKPNAQLILFSCSTGVEDGIAQTMSDGNIIVIGPDANTSPTLIKVHQRKGELKFEVHYREGNANTYSNGFLQR